jgi:hypothetical protein
LALNRALELFLLRITDPRLCRRLRELTSGKGWILILEEIK